MNFIGQSQELKQSPVSL